MLVQVGCRTAERLAETRLASSDQVRLDLAWVTSLPSAVSSWLHLAARMTIGSIASHRDVRAVFELNVYHVAPLSGTPS